MKQDERKRMQAKTAHQRFLNMLTQDFQQAPKIAQVIFEEAQECFLGQAQHLRPGQIRQILLNRDAPHGQALEQMETLEVTWTLDAGQADDEIEAREGAVALRRVRIQRLVDEALNQGAVATQEDLARVLHVSVRTIKRDCAYLQEQGVSLSTRGKLKGIGRGQSHKAQIVGRWLQGETYDQIARRTHHSLTCVKRYVQTFVRVIDLKQKGFDEGQISLLLQVGRPLLADYWQIYAQIETPFCRNRLQEQLERLSGANFGQKKRRLA
jgi:hypothetical protein